MSRATRAFVVVLVIAFLIVGVEEAKPQSRKIPVVGVLNPGRADPTFPSIAALRQGLRALGYVEGQSIRIVLGRADEIIQ